VEIYNRSGEATEDDRSHDAHFTPSN